MSQHSLADAFLSQFPKGANPIIDILKGFTGIVEADLEERKQKNTQGTAQAAPQPPPQAQPAPVPQGIQVPQSPQGQSGIPELLKRFGIPVGAAIAGSVNPNILPQAAGLSRGFTREVIRQAEQQIKQDRVTERKTESKRKEDKRDRKDIREQAERAIDKSKQFFPLPAERARAVKRLEEEMLRAAGLGPGASAVQSRKSIEAGLPGRARANAEQFLRDNGKPVTEKNIKFVIDNQ